MKKTGLHRPLTKRNVAATTIAVAITTMNTILITKNPTAAAAAAPVDVTRKMVTTMPTEQRDNGCFLPLLPAWRSSPGYSKAW